MRHPASGIISIMVEFSSGSNLTPVTTDYTIIQFVAVSHGKERKQSTIQEVIQRGPRVPLRQRIIVEVPANNLRLSFTKKGNIHHFTESMKVYELHL